LEQITDCLSALPNQTRLLVLAPVAAGSQQERGQRLGELARDGFARVKIGAEIYDISEESALAGDPTEPVDLVVDRLALREGVEKRLWDSLETAARYGGQVVKIEAQLPQASNEAPREMIFGLKLACVQCGAALPEITPALFSFNSPHGACPACGGAGVAAARRRGGGDLGMGEPCESCAGTRLRKESLAVKLGRHNVAQVTALSAREALEFFTTLELGERESVIGRKVLGEILRRLRFMNQVGLDYLSLDRPSLTLSGGEAQRVRLATQLGARLAGVLYILDEPSIGLHPRDAAQLLALIKQLRDAGNSVIVVEHDRQTILAADHVVDMGPGAGTQGGMVVAQGAPKELLRDESSLTGRYLSGAITIAAPARESLS
jgi:excinuclease ABC subunit A